MNFVSLFSGIGGEHVALRNAVSSVLGDRQTHNFFAFDNAPRAARSFAANFPSTDFRLRDLSATGALKENLPQIDFLWSSAPCTMFSVARRRFPKNATVANLNSIIMDKWIEPARPSVVVFENVVQMRNWGPIDDNGEFIASQRGTLYKKLLGRLNALGYATSEIILDGADYGDASHRRRLFVVASLAGVTFDAPPTGDFKHKYIADCLSAGEPTFPVERLRGRAFQKMLTYCREIELTDCVLSGDGFAQKSAVARLTDKFKTFAASTKPIVLSHKLSRYRYLTAEEAGCALGFPENFLYANPPSVNYFGVGNSVSVTAVTRLLTMIFEKIWGVNGNY